MKTTETKTAPAKTRHTPEPWDDASQYPEFQSIRIFAKTKYIATVGNSDDIKEETQANASLIAAAPELLEALKVAQAVCGDLLQGGDGIYINARRMINAAIAKATGGSES